jgi:hypothetical protein
MMSSKAGNLTVGEDDRSQGTCKTGGSRTEEWEAASRTADLVVG